MSAKQRIGDRYLRETLNKAGVKNKQRNSCNNKLAGFGHMAEHYGKVIMKNTRNV